MHPHYDKTTYLTRVLYEGVCDKVKLIGLDNLTPHEYSHILREVWVWKAAQKYKLDPIELLLKCNDTCGICNSELLDYGLGYNNINKSDTTTPSIDHIQPTSREGEFSNINNIQIVCNRCNTLKSNATVEDIVRMELIIESLKRQLH